MSEKNQPGSSSQASSGALTDDLVRLGAKASHKTLPIAIVAFLIFAAFGGFLVLVGMNKLNNPASGDPENIGAMMVGFGIVFVVLGAFGALFNSWLRGKLGGSLAKHR